MEKIKTTAFLRGTLLLSVSVVITKIIGVAFKVPLSYVLGDVGMGYFNTAYAIYGFFYILCTAGVPKSITLILTGHGAICTDESERFFVLKKALKLFCIIGLFVTLINIICAPVLARFIGNNKALPSILAIAPSILFVSLSGVLRGYLNSYEHLSEIAISQLLEGIIKLGSGLLLAYIGVGNSAPKHIISALAIMGITLGSVATFVYLVIVAFIKNKDENIRQKRQINLCGIRKNILKNALPIALCASLLNLSSILDLSMIIKRLVVSGESEIYANSLYGNYTTLAVPMFTMVVSVLSPVATSFMARLSTLAVKGDMRKFELQLRNLVVITLLVSVPASLAFFLYSFDLLDVLFSVNSSAVGADMLICLSLGMCSLTLLTVMNTALEAQGRIKITVASLLLGALTKIATSYLLIGKSGIGILGAPIGTVVSYTLSLAISLCALELSGVKTCALRTCFVVYVVGLISFLPPYKMIYSVGKIAGSSFFSMLFSLAISGVIYIFLLSVAYVFLRRERCLICTKKRTSAYKNGRFFGKCNEKERNY